MAADVPAVVRAEVTRLAGWAPLPPEDDDLWDVETVDRFAADVPAVSPPVSVAERDALLALLDGPDDDTVYGVLWGVLHLVETAPDDGYELCLPTAGRPWFALLLTRRRNAAGGVGPAT